MSAIRPMKLASQNQNAILVSSPDNKGVKVVPSITVEKVGIHDIPSFLLNEARKYDTKEILEDFYRKLRFCSQAYDFVDEAKDTLEKTERLEYLRQISEVLNNKFMTSFLIAPNLDQVIEFIKKNIFRRPLITSVGHIDTEDEEQKRERVWLHLEPVYAFFLRMITNDLIIVDSLKLFLTRGFFHDLFCSFDPEESKQRDYLKNIIHRLYAKVIPRRKIIRTAIKNHFDSIIYENQPSTGVAELLEVLASIISGFAIPFRPEHIITFKSILLPLHKVPTSDSYLDQLQRCCMLFLIRDPSLTPMLIEALLNHWPISNTSKEMHFLSELLESFEHCPFGALEPIMPKLLKTLAKCMAGHHSFVAHRAFEFFENEFFFSALKNSKHATFPILAPVVSSLETHWDKSRQESLKQVKDDLQFIDEELFEDSVSQMDMNTLYIIHASKDVKKGRESMNERWQMLTKQAQLKDPNFKEPRVPFSEAVP